MEAIAGAVAGSVDMARMLASRAPDTAARGVPVTSPPLCIFFSGLPMKGHCILSHGFASGPDATKVTALAEAAARLGWSHARPDYTDLAARREVTPLGDVAARIARLLELARDAAARGPLVLAGSSLGAYISGHVSLQVPAAGLFLMAPPVVMEGAPPMPAAT